MLPVGLFVASMLHMVIRVHTLPFDVTPIYAQEKAARINDFIREYDFATYNVKDLFSLHNRVKRDSSRRNELLFDVVTKDRTYKLKLLPDERVFDENVQFASTSGPIAYDTSRTYSGTLQDDETATVHGLITGDGLFDGTITTALDHIYIEPLSRYEIVNEPSKRYHSIVYRQSDVITPTKHCASQRLQRDLANKSIVSRKLLDNNELFVYNRTLNKYVNKWKTRNVYDLNAPDVGRHADDYDYVNGTDLLFRHVNKRATIDQKKTTCMLYLQADHFFYQKYESEEACIEVITRHVQRVNDIYRRTDFNQDGKADNITFMIKRIKVHTTDAVNDPAYRLSGTYGVEKFLELFSEEDYDSFCLAYMFTYRDFEMGTLGLAWTGDLKNAGGVCEKNGHYRGSLKSLNTGIVTLLNYGKHVPPAVSHVTLAHEIGHNFGSPHDPEICTPGGEDGNFIMFARATSGDKKNNNQFSPCSLKSINPVLNYKARSFKGCFEEPQKSLCGNGVVEDGEECDCGWEEDCKDQCCYPQRNQPPVNEPPCRLTPRSICSPSQGPCCTTTCQLKFGDKCRDDNGCRDASFCNGRAPFCPASINKPNKTICNKESVCFMGECTGSICLAYGLESCQCIAGPNDSKLKACELCCKLPGEGQPCVSSFDWNEKPYDVPDMYSKPGTPCNDYNGYCDVFQKCREVDPSGALATLRKLLLSEEGIAGLKGMLLDYWYAFIFIVVFAAVMTGLLIRCLPKSPRKLKNITIMHSSTTETVKLPPDDEVHVHPALKSRLPFKQKVRNGKKQKHPRKKTDRKDNRDASYKKKRRKTDVDNKSKKKEVIDYSSAQKDVKNISKEPVIKHKTSHLLNKSKMGQEETLGKVESWLSQIPVKPNIPKSKSTPVNLSNKPGNGRKSRSNHDLEKMRVQVMYKPPFKFSWKLRKGDVSKVKVDKVADKSKKPRPRASLDTPRDCAMNVDDIDSNIHTVQSDLEVLLSESEFLFSQ